MEISYQTVRPHNIAEFEAVILQKGSPLPFFAWTFVWIGDAGVVSQNYDKVIRIEVGKWNAEEKKSASADSPPYTIRMLFLDITDMDQNPIQVNAVPSWSFMFYPENTPNKPGEPLLSNARLFDAGNGTMTLQSVFQNFTSLQSTLKNEARVKEHLTSITTPEQWKAFLAKTPFNLLFFWEETETCEAQWGELMTNGNVLFACYPKLMIGTINITQCPNIATAYKIKDAPTFILYLDGKPVEGMGTGQVIAMYQWLTRHVKPDKEIESVLSPPPEPSQP